MIQNLSQTGDVAGEINRLHHEIVAAAQTTLHNAIRIGELLADVKAGLPHGEFGPWIKANLPFTDRTARSYMRVFRGRAKLKTESVSGLGAAYRLLSESAASARTAEKSTEREIIWRFYEALRVLRNEPIPHATLDTIVPALEEIQPIVDAWMDQLRRDDLSYDEAVELHDRAMLLARPAAMYVLMLKMQVGALFSNASEAL